MEPLIRTPMVREAFRCPACGSPNVPIHTTRRTRIEHRGQMRRAAQQYRVCRDCEHPFQTLDIK